MLWWLPRPPLPRLSLPSLGYGVRLCIVERDDSVDLASRSGNARDKGSETPGTATAGPAPAAVTMVGVVGTAVAVAAGSSDWPRAAAATALPIDTRGGTFRHGFNALRLGLAQFALQHHVTLDELSIRAVTHAVAVVTIHGVVWAGPIGIFVAALAHLSALCRRKIFGCLPPFLFLPPEHKR